MDIKKGEIQFARAYIKEHFDRIIDWSIGDIRRCCRMNEDGTCEDGGALVGAFILWCCAIEYFGGLYTGLTEPSNTKARFKVFIEKYMDRYDATKVEDLRWSLSHYYSPHHFVLYHKGNLENNTSLHLTSNQGGIMLHLGWAIKDLEDAVGRYYGDLKKDDELKVKVWRFYKKQLPIMPVKVEKLISPTLFASLATGTAMQELTASGTVSQNDWFK